METREFPPRETEQADVLLDRLEAVVAALEYKLLGARPAPPRPALRLVESKPASSRDERLALIILTPGCWPTKRCRNE